MPWTYYLLLGVFVVLLSYKTYSLLYFLILKRKLTEDHLSFFIKELGDGYRYRRLPSGLLRYKWIKNWIIIKANFYENGDLVKGDVPRSNIFKLISEFFIV